VSIVLIIFIVFLIFGAILLSMISRGDTPLAPIAKTLLGLLFGLMALFCIFGFMASFEPGENALVFKIGYAIGFLLTAGLGVWIVLGKSAPRKS